MNVVLELMKLMELLLSDDGSSGRGNTNSTPVGKVSCVSGDASADPSDPC